MLLFSADPFELLIWRPLYYYWLTFYGAAYNEPLFPCSLSFASFLGLERVIAQLLENPDIDVNDVDETLKTPLLYATRHGNLEVVRVLLATPEVDLNTSHANWTPLCWAAGNVSLLAVQQLLRAADINVNRSNNHGQTPLSESALMGHQDIVRELLKNFRYQCDSSRWEWRDTAMVGCQ